MNDKDRAINEVYEAQYHLHKAYEHLHDVAYNQEAKFSGIDLADIREALHSITVDDLLLIQRVIADINYRDPNAN